jgi:tetratricopeptide (TPR) repeat protein
LNYRRGDYSSAIALLENAANALPNNGLIQYHLGMSYLAIGQREKALEQLKKASEHELDNKDLTAKVRAALAAASKAELQPQ